MADADGLPIPQRFWSITAILLGMFMAVLDTSIANVALPTLAQELKATAAQSIWVINAYQLGSVMLLLPLAACGEMLGYKRVYLAGMLVFTVASAICIFAPSLQILTLGRGLQGMGSAGLMSMNAALVRLTYPRRLIGRGLGINAFVVGLSTAAAPAAASAILALANWRWLFAVNIPLCAAALVLGGLALPTNAPARRPFDAASAVLCAVLFGALVVGADMVGRGGSMTLGFCLLAISAACAALVIARGWRQDAPLFPIDLLRIPMFGLSIATSTASFCALLIASVSMPFLFQRVLERSVVETGLLMTPLPIATALAAAWAGVLSERYPGAILNSIGLLAMAAALMLLAAMPPGVSDLDIVWRAALCGAGFGFFQSPNNRTMVLAAPRSRGGATGGALATARTTGQSLGAVLVGVLFGALPLGPASRWALVAAGALAVAGAAVSSLRLGRSLPSEAPDAAGPDALADG